MNAAIDRGVGNNATRELLEGYGSIEFVRHPDLTMALVGYRNYSGAVRWGSGGVSVSSKLRPTGAQPKFGPEFNCTGPPWVRYL